MCLVRKGLTFLTIVLDHTFPREIHSNLYIHMCACVHAKLLQLCLTLCDSMDCSLPGSSVYGILQARILEWVAMPSFRGSSQSRDWIQVSCIAGGFFTFWANREAQSPLSVQFLRLTLKSPSSENQQGSAFESHKIIAKKEIVVKGHMNTSCCYLVPKLSAVHMKQEWNASISVFPWKSYDCILFQLQPYDQLVMNPYLRADWDAPWSLKELVGVFTTFSLKFIPTKPSH